MIGTKYSAGRDNGVDNRLLNAINEEIRSHPVEVTGEIGGGDVEMWGDPLAPRGGGWQGAARLHDDPSPL